MKRNILISILKKFDPEFAHNIAILSLKYGLQPKRKITTDNILKTKISGINLKHPIGLSAGFDKNAEAIKGLVNIGFSFIEIGAVTPLPQKGNKKPRIHRILEEEGIINSLGFNNKGMNKIYKNLLKKPDDCIIGVNLGSNKNTIDRSLDFIKVLKLFHNDVDFATLNISSPNTDGLKELQINDELEFLLSKVSKEKDNLSKKIPIFIKISPDLNDKQLENIVNQTIKFNLAGIIATNTSTTRKNLSEKWRNIKGGLSGKPIFKESTITLAKVSQLSDSKFPIIGVGGIFSADDAYEKICAGASALQIYSALTFIGPKVINDICEGLEKILKANGFKNISEAVGTKKNNW